MTLKVIIPLISTLKVVLFSWKLSTFHRLFSFPVTDFLYRNEYSFVLLLFVILISLPLQYFYKYDCDYPAQDKTRQTLPKNISNTPCKRLQSFYSHATATATAKVG